MTGLILIVVGIVSLGIAALFAWAEKGGAPIVKFTIPWPKEVAVSLTGPVAIFSGAGVILLILGVILGPKPIEPSGQIVSPASGQVVERDIEARGVLENIPNDDHVWLVVRDGNLLYPQESEIGPPDGEWSLHFHQGGTSRTISLELYRVNDEGNAFISNRLEEEDFSGMSRIPGAVRLDVAENVQIRNRQRSVELSPEAITASATSVHPPEPQGLTYDAVNTLDGNPNTAWNGNGECIGCRLRYDFSRTRKLGVVSVVNGYAKNESVFRANARLREVRFMMSGERQFRHILRDTPTPQDIRGDFGTTEYLELEILSVYPGDESHLNDAAVTDIDFFNE